MKVNDKVICVSTNSRNATLNRQPKIYKHQIYTIEDITTHAHLPYYIKLKELQSYYSSELFLTVKEHRQFKLIKLYQKNT